MISQDRESILAVCLMAAFADGNNDERERAEIKRITESIAEGADFNTAALYQKVLQKQVTVFGRGLHGCALRYFPARNGQFVTRRGGRGQFVGLRAGG